jgi:AcrR family transcriptional regulator
MATVKSRRSQGAQLPARDRLLHAAEILAARRLHGLTMEKVAAASGVGRRPTLLPPLAD